MVKLFVSGFPLEAEEMELVKLFAPYGDVSTIKIVRDRKTGVCKGYAFLEMADLEGAENAVGALNGAEMAGRELRVNISEDKPAAPPPRFRKVAPRYPSSHSSPRSSSSSSYGGGDAGAPERKKRPRRPF